MAVNALLYIWTSGDAFVPKVPGGVKEVVGNASLWLVKNAKKGKAYNVVFSGSVKSSEVGQHMPDCYPMLVYIFLFPGPPILLPCEFDEVSEWFCRPLQYFSA